MRASCARACVGALLLMLCAALPVLANYPLTFTTCDTDGTSKFQVGGVEARNASFVPGVATRMLIKGSLDADVDDGAYSLVLSTEENELIESSFGSLKSLVPSLPQQPSGDYWMEFELIVPSAAVIPSSDSFVTLRLQASDQIQEDLFCVSVTLPLTPSDNPAPGTPAKSSNKVLGYACALISVVFFGTNFLPVKQFETGDGVFFQWMLCIGVWSCGLVVQLIRNSAFEPLAMLGGVMWCVGNMCTVPIIQLIGLGVGMCLWGSATLIMGCASGRFGLLGIKKQTIENQAMNIVGLLLCVASMGIMLQVKSVKEEQARASARNDLDHALLAESVNSHESYALRKRPRDSSSPDDLELAVGGQQEGNWTDSLSTSTKRIVGITLALGAGCLYGLNFNPPQYLIDSGKGKSSHGIDYVFSHFCGILATSTVYMLVWAAHKRNAPWVSSQIVLPGVASGIGWAIAQISWFVANDQIHFVGTFPIVSCGPGIVATLCAIVLYKEIQGRKNYLLLGATAAVTIVGVILIALSLPAGA